MVNKEALEGMTAEQVMQLLQEVKERRRTAIALANDVINGYQKAVNVRDAKIKELRDDLSEQLASIADKAAALNAAMLQASLTGDGVEMEKAQCTKTEIHVLLNQYPELGISQGYVAALSEFPSGIIVRARKSDPITAKAVLNKALNWKDQLLVTYPDLASGRRSSPWPWRPQRNT